MFKVTLTAGGPLSGPAYDRRYEPGVTYDYPESKRAYVESLSGRFEVVEVPDAKPAPAPAAKAPDAKAPAAGDKSVSKKAS